MYIVDDARSERSKNLDVTNVPLGLRGKAQEEENVKVVLEYMEIAYSPTNAGSDSVAHLCAPGNTFEARSTFPDAHTAEEYAESHAKVMHALNNLEIVRFDYVIAKENFVSLRYTATGSHVGAPHNDIRPTGRRAQWTACGNFVLDNFNTAAGEKSRIRKWLKGWDKTQMWQQLRWVRPNNDKV
ncbi:uncharacterized protein STEHIDRAFT_116405 [Stereum hirsutum FP-91666 SS1]|uniref:SnoaL-like domain-containing protein n=1 Tax=Stereum hirsutum (strain FP-91666) TaxID=721885 RepID=R7RWG8_STEHR|nr:uncharacterized protein STEHIDRAFT_116405 [Stereum hirsutum FP-91666 SS1]EIM79711.1 hypothetical protein STEHIDRAFT_116405 [Stereum hirsutum FP-91666 SS1]